MHGAGWVHLDVKDHNVFLVSPNAERPRVSCKLGDFGNAAQLTGENRQTSMFMGTSGWAAPEVIEEPTTVATSPAADMFSFGVLIWRTLTDIEVENPLAGLAGDT